MLDAGVGARGVSTPSEPDGPSSPDARVVAGIGLVLVTLVVRLVPAWQLQAVVHDVATYWDMAEAVLRGDNIYRRRVFFPYLPFSQFLPAGAMQVADATGWRFDFVVKLPPIFADAGSTALIFGYTLWRGLSLRPAVGWSLAWALNPVSILVTAFHGNLMAAVPFFVLASFVAARVAETSEDRDLLVALSGLLLGIAIALRTYPILFAPVFLVLCIRTSREAAVSGLLAAVPGGLSSIPYLIYARQTFLTEIAGYSGFTDFGWVSVIRALPHLAGRPKLFAFDAELVERTKVLFLLGYGLVVLSLPFFRRDALERALLLAPLLFYGLYGGLSAQYLVWVLPIALVLRDPLALIFSAIATVALITFYASYAPAILFGRYPAVLGDDPLVATVNAWANTLLVALSLGWTARILLGELRAYRGPERSTPVPWVRTFGAWWSSRAYAAGLVILLAVWLYQIGRVGLRARDVVRAILQ